MNRPVKLALILLTSAVVLLGGCLRRPEPAAAPTPTTTPAIANRPAPTATATRVVPPTSAPSPTATNEPPPPQSLAKSGYQDGYTERGEPFRGDPAAPVVFEEFSSYQCGFCGRYFRESFPQVIANYVETGHVLYVFRDFPLPGQPQSPLAAEAANCAGQVGGGSAYWAMHDLIFERQREWSGRGNAGDILRGYAAELDLDGDAFGECLDSKATHNQVQADLREGTARGVRGTPTFFINGQPLVGAQPYNVIAQAIDAAMSTEPSAGVTLELAPASALSTELRQLPPEVQEAYRFALANPHVLEVIPCYCGCGSVGHMSNRMCYVQSQGTDGKVVFDNHALG